jgi:hypothetical protein
MRSPTRATVLSLKSLKSALLQAQWDHRVLRHHRQDFEYRLECEQAGEFLEYAPFIYLSTPNAASVFNQCSVWHSLSAGY